VTGQGALAQKPLCQDSGRKEGIEPPLWRKYEIEGVAGAISVPCRGDSPK